MNLMKSLISAAAVVAVMCAYGQGKPGPGGQPGQHGGLGREGGMRRGMPDELKKLLNLTPAQEKTIQAIRDKYMAKLRPPSAVPGQRPDFEKMRPIIEAMRKEMDAVFTPKQRE